ncbi:MAG: type IV pilus biogenesis/stability protein PilW [Methylomonas sp.]|nr:type IV pilus biogenesis/stability protein PilW [Methylomonas sp.]PPD21870.1 MAG: type IV pilus biogenesis/stability protein PilW [Methylomonas sp.]PPD27150.1 MAG: type IV pilus biogenesis/stability protein PilW [Methylomonas sp.]PPD37266.1 MAG: type IV pilus biogenesis/stability protein PilW [Methylomonas sp.]PPD39104.1 MAG: type IV pilus biogenesis/stability protein PilW [Methylomonas sp.]
MTATLLGALLAGCNLTSRLTDGKSNAEKAQLNLQLGVRYLEMGMIDVAQEKLEAALSQDSGNADIHNALAILFERIKDYDEAADYYRSALRRDPENTSIKSNYGRLLCERNDVEKGKNLLQEALASPVNPRPWIALTNMGLCFIQQNDRQRGEDFFRQALNANADYAPSLLEMLKISYANQQFMSARAFLQRYLAIAKHTAETLWLGFQTERALGNATLADEYKQQLLNDFPASREAQDIRAAPNH